MKTINSLVLLSAWFIIVVACNSKQSNVSKSGVTMAENVIQRGAEFDYQAKSIDINTLYKKMKNVGVLETTVSGEVEKVCLKKGCWMTIKNAEADPMRVTFKDYAFFMPMDIHDKQVIFKGKAYQDTTSVDMLRHYAEDEGLSQTEINKITEPKIEIAFEATGVYIQ